MTTYRYFPVLILAGLAACSDVDVGLRTYGHAASDVSLETRELGRLGPGDIDARRAQGDIDGVALLPAGACEGPCRLVELTVFVHNRGAEPLAPPVLRLQSPAGRAARLPVSLRAREISPGRVGRIRWLVALWPEEDRLEASLSGSVFLD